MAEKFITQFHNLEGVSVGVKQRNLNKFLLSVSLTPEEKWCILDNLKPKTYLENLFYIDVLIHLRETSQLLRIFKEGNGPFVSKIVKQPWFFKEAFDDITPKVFVEEFLPSLSYSMKIKLLKSLTYAYTEKKIDEIFDRIIEKYGLHIATTFLPACSSEKIAEVLKKNKVILSTHKLKLLYKKRINLINIYLDEQKRYKQGEIFDKHFLTYLAQRNPKYFWEILKELGESSDVKLGRRTTKKVLIAKKEEIVTDPNKYINHLRHETLVRKLNKLGEFEQFYYNLFPQEPELLQSQRSVCIKILKYYPKNAQYDLFERTFRSVTEYEIWSFSNCMEDILIKHIPDVKKREAWALLKYKESNNEEYLKFYETQHCITLVKEKINTTSSIKTRRTLICLLVKTCGINKDLKALEEVLKYFCARHRNDNKTVRTEFLQEVEKNFNLEDLNGTHWKYINEIFTIQSLNKEYTMPSSLLRVKHIEYLFNNDGSQEDKEYSILEYIKEQLVGYYFTFNTLEKIKNPDIKRTILLKIMEYLEDLLKNRPEESDRTYFWSQALGKIFHFNSKYPENAINIQENKMVVEILKSISGGRVFTGYEFKRHFAHNICKSNRNDLENELLKFYFLDTDLRTDTFDKVLLWFLKYDPMVVVKNLDSVMKRLPLKPYTIWNKIKKYSHLSLDDKVVKYCADKIKNGDVDTLSEFVEPLSILGSTEYYLKIMEDLNFIPISPKVVVDDEDSKKVYSVQKAFLQNLGNVKDPLKYLPLLVNKFCQGDYLQGSLAPLYYAFINVPENKLESYLDELANNNAMSVNKHAFFLACYVFDESKISQMFHVFDGNKNESLQKCLFLSCLRYFMKNSKQVHFERMITYLNYLKHHDTETLNMLTNSQTIVAIPKDFKSRYIINLWNLLETLKTNDNAVGINRLMSDVLNNIEEEDMKLLPEDFRKRIVDNYFLNLGCTKREDQVPSILKFAIKYLMYSDNRTESFTYTFALVSNYKLQFWNSMGKERNAIHKFFGVFLILALTKEVNMDFVVRFSEQWNKIFTPSDTFKEYVLLNLLRFKKEASNDFQAYPQHVVAFSELIKHTHGEFVFYKFISILSEFLDQSSSNTERIEILTDILKYKTSTVTCLLVIELLSIKGRYFCKNMVKPKFQEIDSILRKVTDSTVQLCYNVFLRREM